MVYDEAWKEFFDDKMTRNVLNGSEVFRNYERAELQREALREKLAAQKQEQDETQATAMLEAIEKKIASSSALRDKLIKAKQAIETVPGLRHKVDPKLIEALNLIGPALKTEGE